jgi:glycosyltransferase involved in cell wall biosynthesis
MRVGFLGGVSPALGGGGLEVQIARTASALEARGHEIVRVETAAADASWDLLHAFGAEGNVQFALEHWTRARTPLVVSPVLVVSPGPAEWALHASARLPAPATHALLRRRALERADALVAITAYEARVLRRQVGRGARIELVPNGVDVVTPAPEPGPTGHVLLLGAVSERKRQREAVTALAGSGPVVVAGGFLGSPAERAAWDAAVTAAGVAWLGAVEDPARVARLLSDAAVLVHWSRAEVQSLAVLEALAHGTPAVVSDIPSHRELAAAHPEWVRVARRAEALPGLVAALRARRPAGPPPRPPGWAEVAARLEALYGRLA